MRTSFTASWTQRASASSDDICVQRIALMTLRAGPYAARPGTASLVSLWVDEDLQGTAMATEPAPRGVEAKMDAASLYREEIYTDRGAGTIRVLVPVTRDGGPDQTRTPIYVGEAQ